MKILVVILVIIMMHYLPVLAHVIIYLPVLAHVIIYLPVLAHVIIYLPVLAHAIIFVVDSSDLSRLEEAKFAYGKEIVMLHM